MALIFFAVVSMSYGIRATSVAIAVQDDKARSRVIIAEAARRTNVVDRLLAFHERVARLTQLAGG